jgi:hypothetical protein
MKMEGEGNRNSLSESKISITYISALLTWKVDRGSEAGKQSRKLLSWLFVYGTMGCDGMPISSEFNCGAINLITSRPQQLLPYGDFPNS